MNMQRVAGLTVVGNGNGEFLAMYNGQRDRVVEACKAEIERQKERADYDRGKRFEMLGEKTEMMRKHLMRRRGPIRRALNAIETAWAMIWAIWHCLPEMGESAGLWEVVREENENEDEH